MSATPANTADIVFGLNSDAATDEGYTGIDYAWNVTSGGGVYIYESGTLVQTIGASGSYTPGDLFMIVYDGQNVRYSINGTLYRTSKPGVLPAKLAFDSSYFSAGASLSRIRVGPLSATNIGSLPEQGQGGALNSDPGCSDINAWTISAGGPVVVASITDGASGLTCLRSSGYSVSRSKLVAVAVGKTYRGSAWLRKPSGTGTTYLEVHFFSGTGTLLAYDIGVNNVTDTSTWLRRSGTLVAPSGAVSAQIVVTTNYAAGTGTTEAQDVRLEEVINTDLMVDEAATKLNTASSTTGSGILPAGTWAITRCSVSITNSETVTRQVQLEVALLEAAYSFSGSPTVAKISYRFSSPTLGTNTRRLVDAILFAPAGGELGALSSVEQLSLAAGETLTLELLYDLTISANSSLSVTNSFARLALIKK